MQSFGILMAEADHRPGLQSLAALATTDLVGVQCCCFALLSLGGAAMAKKRHKGSKFDENFVGIVYSVFECPAFYALSSFACKLLFDLIGQYRGDNNGDLTVAWSNVSERGWRSRTTLYRAKKELIDAGFVHVTRKGRMPSTCELLALTWFPLDVSKKFDFDAVAGFRSKAYRDATPLPLPKIKDKPDWTQPNGGRPVSAKQSPLSTSGTSAPPQVH